MNESPLTNAQIAVAKAFFDLPESEGFLIVGGAALLALGLSSRPTQDLDVFTAPPTIDVSAALNAFEKEAAKRAWAIERINSSPTFARFAVTVDDATVLMDLAIDASATDAPTMTVLGPTMAAEDVAARKVLALFDRAAARDFVDVFVLARQFDKNELLRRAAELDLGLASRMFASTIRMHARFEDDDFVSTGHSADALRAFFDSWATELDG